MGRSGWVGVCMTAFACDDMYVIVWLVWQELRLLFSVLLQLWGGGLLQLQQWRCVCLCVCVSMCEMCVCVLSVCVRLCVCARTCAVLLDFLSGWASELASQ